MQISMPFADKLDAPLAELCNGQVVGPSSRVPVVVRYAEGPTDDLVEYIRQLGGKIRHQIPFVRVIGAWLPLHAVERLAARESVVALELEQRFTIA